MWQPWNLTQQKLFSVVYVTMNEYSAKLLPKMAKNANDFAFKITIVTCTQCYAASL